MDVKVSIHADGVVICPVNSPVYNYIESSKLYDSRVWETENIAAYVVYDIEELREFLRMSEISFKDVPARPL